ncbi:hypothetical protein EV673_0138 [Limnobacter thiooxidans]|uniref:Uncharacterized protein n=1 Tax=Limnobacter thiooxidans TaxID=131080 RepID=A0AA86MIW1_9BURK|nr:hypothetical protein [Limnobacter sp.]MCZ8014543.1 hypothetical protein [Limnobacter sp.]RZS41823.1 hypothetical protein EV673_0138 [Limnobacter thiooxidans]BET26742.1 hypothetical protein RGQ30_22430 [Limnobacter thiooxidans]
MKDVENLFQRLGTRSDYKDFGSKMLDDVRSKWPLLNDVSESEKLRHQASGAMLVPVVAHLADAQVLDANTSGQSPQAVIAKVDSMEFKAQAPEQKLPVRAFVSRKPQPASSVRDIFKSIGKSGRLSSPETAQEVNQAAVSATVPKGRSLFASNKPKDGNKV